jgi:hypothetical protein
VLKVEVHLVIQSVESESRSTSTSRKELKVVAPGRGFSGVRKNGYSLPGNVFIEVTDGTRLIHVELAL